MQLAEDLAAAFGDIRVQSVQVNTTNLVLGATRLKSMFEDRTIRIPRSAELREALHRPRKIQGLAGGMVIKLARDAKGHCDEFVGYALAALAAHEGGEAGPVREESVATQPFAASLVGADRAEGGFAW
jgi:phage FluMu gp28-like protein